MKYLRSTNAILWGASAVIDLICVVINFQKGNMPAVLGWVSAIMLVIYIMRLEKSLADDDINDVDTDAVPIKRYKLRNGIVVVTTGELCKDNVQIVSVPKEYKGDFTWYIGEKFTLGISSEDMYNPLTWTGGGFEEEYDIVEEVK